MEMEMVCSPAPARPPARPPARSPARTQARTHTHTRTNTHTHIHTHTYTHTHTHTLYVRQQIMKDYTKYAGEDEMCIDEFRACLTEMNGGRPPLPRDLLWGMNTGDKHFSNTLATH
jgi:hypothetical protein